jgi:alkylation response protein AidB-like acyl-CoA dehydrogenase
MSAPPPLATPGPAPADLGELRNRVTGELKAILTERTASSRSTVLGAGNNDLAPGRHFLQLLAPGGYMTPGWPTEHGGMGLDQAASDVVAEVRSGFEAPDLYPWLVAIDLIGPTIMAHGTPEQARRWLGPIRTGTEIWCQLFSEPDAGSDLANVKARAVRDGDTWRINGSKVWTSRGHYSEWGLLLARTDGSVPKHRGITAFGLDMRTPGVTVRPLVQMNGDAHFNEVFLDDVIVPDADRLGAPGEGWRVAITCLSHERGALAGGLGVSLDQLLALGRSPGVAGDPVRRDRLARAITGLQIGRWGGERALEARRAGAAPGPEGSLAKLATNALIRNVAALGLESEGPAATLAEPTDEWQTMWLVSPSLSIRGGTDEIQRNIIGERSLGLPPEPRLDKDRPFDDRPDKD